MDNLTEASATLTPTLSESVQRREALKRIGKYGLCTAPVMMLLVNSAKAAAICVCIGTGCISVPLDKNAADSASSLDSQGTSDPEDIFEPIDTSAPKDLFEPGDSTTTQPATHLPMGIPTSGSSSQ